MTDTVTNDELTQIQSSLAGRKVCLINLAAFSMAVGDVTKVTRAGASVNLNVQTDRGDQTIFSLPEPVKAVTTQTGYRFESEKLVLQVDFMPE